MTHNPNAHKPTLDLIREAALTTNKLVVAVSGSSQFQGMTSGNPQENGMDWSNWPLRKLFAAMLMRIDILKLAGTATIINWEIRQEEGGTGVNVVASGMSDALDYSEDFAPFKPWINAETDKAKAGLIWIEITPTNGTLDAQVRLVAEPKN